MFAVFFISVFISFMISFMRSLRRLLKTVVKFSSYLANFFLFCSFLLVIVLLRHLGGKKMKNECVPRTIFDQLHFVSLFKFWSMLHHVWLWWFENKKYYFMLLYTFLTFFCFLLWNLPFYHFLFFFDNVSNFLNIILTNKKQALVIINYLWNCMEWMLQRCWYISTH